MKNILNILAFIALFQLTLTAQTEEGYGQTLATLFELSGTEQTFQTVITEMFAMVEYQYPDISSEYWDQLEEEMRNTSMEDFLTMITPVYKNHLSHDDLKELIKFYKTPVGKKYAERTPAITEESMAIGQQWGMKLAQEIIARIENKE